MSRSAQSVAILLALATLLASPSWHGNHPSGLLPSAGASDGHGTSSRLSAATPAAGAADSCPICYFHRLLSQTSITLPLEAAGPYSVVAVRTASRVAPRLNRSSHVAARAPPAC